ncbi:MAG: DUF6504 family protein [Armatimonadota bacterium]
MRLSSHESQFIGEEVQVECTDGRPVRFTWRGRQYRVLAIKQQWFDTRFGHPTSRIRKGWWQRHRRTRYRVLADDGVVYELYWDRASVGKKWILYRAVCRDSGASATTTR